MREWIMHPLLDVDAINARLDALEELNAQPDAKGPHASCVLCVCVSVVVQLLLQDLCGEIAISWVV